MAAGSWNVLVHLSGFAGGADSGVIVGRRVDPIVYQGEALVDIAEVESG